MGSGHSLIAVSGPFSSSRFSCFTAEHELPHSAQRPWIITLGSRVAKSEERDLFAWDNQHLFQFTDQCFSLGVSLSILVLQSESEPVAVGCISPLTQGYSSALTCFTTHQHSQVGC